MRPRGAAAAVPDAGARADRAGRARAAATFLVALLLAGCGDGGDSPPAAEPPESPAQRTEGAPPQPSDAEQIRALVADRAAPLGAGDPGAYAATAAGDRRGSDRRAARRARRIGVRGVTLDVESVRVRGRRARVRVAAAYEIAGVRSSFESPRRLTAVRRGGRWRIRAVRDERGVPPWEVAAFSRRRTRHFVVLAPPEVPADAVVPALDVGYDRMRELLKGGVLRRRYLVVVAGDAAQARALTTEIRGVESLAAISDATIVEEGPAREVTEVVSVRLLVNWPAFSQLDAERRARVITHELTHAALAGSTSGRTPAWLVEGVALYVSGDRRPAPPGVDLAALSRPEAIARLSGEAQATAYAASSAAAFAIADRHGRRALLRLLDAFGDPSLEGEPGRRLVNRALRRELGTSLAELQAS